jgi:hypothetical protein
MCQEGQELYDQSVVKKSVLMRSFGGERNIPLRVILCWSVGE